MASFTILHLADLHLDSPLRGLEADPDAPADTIRGATREALVRAVAFAIERKVALVLIAGDLFDGDWNDWRTGHFLVAQLSLLARAGIPVVAIRGNHDADNVITRTLPPIDGVRMLRSDRAETIRFPQLGLAVHGQSFATREMFENLALNYPGAEQGLLNIGLLHTSATGREGHTSYAPCMPEQLRAHGYDYWALGHIHRREVLATDPWIVFSGNLQGRQIKEDGDKGGTLITITDGRIESVDHVSFDVLRWERLTADLTGAPDAEAAFATIRNACAEALARAGGRLLVLRIRLVGATAAHASLSRDAGETRERIRAELLTFGGPDVVWLEGIRIRTRGIADLEGLRARSEAIAGLIGAIETQTGAAFGDEPKAYATTMLERVPGLKDQLGPEHPAVQVAAGTIPAELLARARNLLLARLAED